jgi:hypothetical protein
MEQGFRREIPLPPSIATDERRRERPFLPTARSGGKSPLAGDRLKKGMFLEYHRGMDIEKALVPGAKVYFIGIKGTGMCALAELLVHSGVHVSGSDRDEVFYTDGILKELGIPYHESFAPEHIPGGIDLVVYSAA